VQSFRSLEPPLIAGLKISQIIALYWLLLLLALLRGLLSRLALMVSSAYHQVWNSAEFQQTRNTSYSRSKNKSEYGFSLATNYTRPIKGAY